MEALIQQMDDEESSNSTEENLTKGDSRIKWEGIVKLKDRLETFENSYKEPQNQLTHQQNLLEENKQSSLQTEGVIMQLINTFSKPLAKLLSIEAPASKS